MAYFRVTVKTTKIANGVRLEKGMSVDFPSSNTSPLSANGGKEILDAFMRKYGIDIKKAGALGSNYLDVQRVGQTLEYVYNYCSAIKKNVTLINK